MLCLTAGVLLIAAASFLAPPSGGVSRFREDPDFARNPGYRIAMRTAQAGDYVHAAAAFGALADREPHSGTGAWARYQQAVCFRALHREAEMRAAFERVRRDYPESFLAGRAGEETGSTTGAPSGARGQAQRAQRGEEAGRGADCGPRALVFACAKLGVRASLEALRREAGTTGAGTTLEGLATAAETQGLKAEGVQVDRDALAALDGPAIARVDGQHYVAVLSVSGETATIHDPNREREERVSLEELLRRTGGIILALRR